ncbi:SH3 domain-binding protein 5-like [Eumeta japonica]|uniref:SH3 domain-binding protein 5-like n=1 Tax=Eumeta variegata TaxID=151549 RepID=A0A4C1YEF1_EUMVA|nr:SH3 domain-binding protein 5-like [Eumeta japonica]
MTDGSTECAEALDPRVQVELERLNSATDEINRLELELDEARLAFRRLLAEGHIRIQQLTRKLGTSIHKARPYYEARFRANITHQELQAATIAYDKANSAHSAAREMVYLAEQGLARLAEESEGGVTLDPAWQEMLNHATSRVNQAEADRAAATIAQRSRAAAHRAAATLVAQLQNSLKRHITKSRPYFEEKARINAALEAQKARIQSLEESVAVTKQQYSAALRNLERISDEIHRHRSRRTSMKTVSTINGVSNDTIPDDNLEDIIDHSADESVREWLRRTEKQPDRGDQDQDQDTWTEIDLEYSSPEEVSFEKCSIHRRPSPDKLPLTTTRVSAASPRRIIRTRPSAVSLNGMKANKSENGLSAKDSSNGPMAQLTVNGASGALPRRQSLDQVLHETGEKVKEMFHGFSLFGERRGSESAPRTPRRAASPRTSIDTASDERFSDTDSLASVEMLSDDQIASLMLDAQLEAVCERLAGAVLKQSRDPV